GQPGSSDLRGAPQHARCLGTRHQWRLPVLGRSGRTRVARRQHPGVGWLGSGTGTDDPGYRDLQCDQNRLTLLFHAARIILPKPSEGGGVRLKLDLHDIFDKGRSIDKALNDVIDDAERKKAKTVEIIPGKGSGQLKKRVLRFLERKDIKARYHRVEKDVKNSGRVWVHFRH